MPLCQSREVPRDALSLTKAPSHPWFVLSLHVLWPDENLKQSTSVPYCLESGCVGSSCIVCVLTRACVSQNHVFALYGLMRCLDTCVP